MAQTRKSSRPVSLAGTGPEGKVQRQLSAMYDALRSSEPVVGEADEPSRMKPAKQTRRKHYRRARIKQKRDEDIKPADIEARVLRALRTYRHLDDTKLRSKIKLKCADASWVQLVTDWEAREVEEISGQKPTLRPEAVADLEIVMPWFNGLTERYFVILWTHVALELSFQRIGDVTYRDKYDAQKIYSEAVTAVIENSRKSDNMDKVGLARDAAVGLANSS
jgi:hypothetical protein